MPEIRILTKEDKWNLVHFCVDHVCTTKRQEVAERIIELALDSRQNELLEIVDCDPVFGEVFGPVHKGHLQEQHVEWP